MTSKRSYVIACQRIVAILFIFLPSFLSGDLKSFAATAPSGIQDTSDMGFTPTPPPGSEPKKDTSLPGGYLKMSGKYRLAAGVGEDFILNDSEPQSQERNSDYLFGEYLNNTYDRGVYSQFLLNVDFSPAESVNFYTQIVNDPWSWTGTTGEQVQVSDIGGEVLRYNLKYFGANNSTLSQTFRTNTTDSVLIPKIKVHDGHLTGGTVAHGFFDYNPATNGIPFTIPELDVDMEFRPIRKLWMDYGRDEWKLRIFALADQEQAMTTDDPLGLSNHKAFWQWSPWLEEYRPIQYFSDGSLKRGYYSNNLAYAAKDSEGNRLVLLRGAALLWDSGDTYFGAEVAAPFTPWDEDYFDANNIPGALRFKKQVTDDWMLGSTYTFRNGLIDGSVADSRQVVAVDTNYRLTERVNVLGEVAYSSRERDQMAGEGIRSSQDDMAYKAGVIYKDERGKNDQTDVELSYTQMGQDFEPALSRYANTRDDTEWGTHLSFKEYTPDLEAFRLGDGVDINRSVIRARWREQKFAGRFENLFDARNVHRTENTAYVETVLRDEMTIRINSRLTGKALFRWHGMSETTARLEPFMSSFYFNGDLIDVTSPNYVFQNNLIPAGEDADRRTFAGALQYLFNKEWTGELYFERTNNIPDFPRGLMLTVFRDANDRVDGLLLDHLTPLLYNQGELRAVPPYPYFNIVRERLVYRPSENLEITFHAAQNGYKAAGAIDDGFNHEGISANFKYSEKLSLFFDYTHSRVLNVPKLIASGYTQSDVEDHHNFYTSADYRINASTVFRAEYGVFGLGADKPKIDPYSVSDYSLPTLDTEHLLRASLNGEF